jgi:hypothetical protein
VIGLPTLPRYAIAAGDHGRSAVGGDLSVGGIISQAIAGGAGGAILTAIVGAIKNKAAA